MAFDGDPEEFGDGYPLGAGPPMTLAEWIAAVAVALFVSALLMASLIAAFSAWDAIAELLR